jgi:hypothetical protein
MAKLFQVFGKTVIQTYDWQAHSSLLLYCLCDD